MKAIDVLTLLILTASASGCVTDGSISASPLDKKMSVSKKVPGLEGHVVVTTTNFNSNLIDLSIKKMARPNKINPKAKTYVVWELPAGAKIQPQSIGLLMPDKFQNARLMTATPFRQFDLFVTVEAAKNPSAPTGEKLLWISVDR
jgi:hypothetical protein